MMATTFRPRSAGCRGPIRILTTRACGFTLVELLVVIGIIVLILGVAITVGRSVANSGRVRATENILRTLDSGLSGDIAANEGPPPLIYYGEDATGTTYAFPIVDGRIENRQLPYPSPWPQPSQGQPRFDQIYDPAQPSLSLLILQSGQDSQLSRAVQTIDSKFVVRQQVPAYGWRASRDPSTGQWRINSANVERRMIEATVVQDGFGNPVRVVLPGSGGGVGDYFNPTSGQMVTRDPLEITPPVAASATGTRPTAARIVRSYRPFNPASVNSRRPVGDADEGQPISARPYLYSAGADGDPGTRRDNVYVTVPAFETETRNFPTPMN